MLSVVGQTRPIWPERQRCYPAVCVVHVDFLIHEVKKQLIFDGQANLVVALCSLKHVSSQTVYFIGCRRHTWRGVGWHSAVNLLSDC